MDNKEVEKIIDKYINMLFKMILNVVKNIYDAEDVLQEVFIELIKSPLYFENDYQEKAYIIKITYSKVINYINKRNKTTTFVLNDEIQGINEEYDGLFEAILSLPSNYSTVIYLYYYQGYNTPEISRIMKVPENTVYTWLSRGKEKLKEIWGDLKDE